MPVSLLALVGAGFIQIYTRYLRQPTFAAMKAAAPAVMEEAAKESADRVAVPIMQKAAETGANAVVEKVPEVAAQVAQAAPNYALWFLFGCVFVIVLMFIFELIRARREK